MLACASVWAALGEEHEAMITVANHRHFCWAHEHSGQSTVFKNPLSSTQMLASSHLVSPKLALFDTPIWSRASESHLDRFGSAGRSRRRRGWSRSHSVAGRGRATSRRLVCACAESVLPPSAPSHLSRAHYRHHPRLSPAHTHISTPLNTAYITYSFLSDTSKL